MSQEKPSRQVRRPRLWRRCLWACVVMLALMLAACGGTTQETIKTEDLQILKSPYVKIEQGTQKDLDLSFQMLADPKTDLEQRVEIYRFIKKVNLSIWNNIRNKIDEIEGGDYQEMLRVGRLHFKKSQWANALVWRELEKIHRRTAPSRQVKVPPEEHFAKIWAKHDSPTVADKEMRSLLKALVVAKGSDLYVDPNFVADIRYSVAVFRALEGKAGGDIESMKTLVHGDDQDALLYALNLAMLQERLALRPDRSGETLRVVVGSYPGTLQAFEAQLNLIKTLWQTRHFAKLKRGSDGFDTSTEGLALLRKAGDEMALLRRLFDERETWTPLDQQKLSEVQAKYEDVPRQFLELMLGALATVDDSTLLEMGLASSETFHLIFPSCGYANRLHRAEAEILHASKRYDEAFKKFESARQLYGDKTDERRDIVRKMKDVAVERKKGFKLPKGPVMKPTDIPPVLHDFNNAGGRYADAFLDEEPAEAWAIRYEIALIRYIYGSPQSAEGVFEELINKHPSHPLAAKAAIALLDLQGRKAVMKRDRSALDNTINLVEGTPEIREVDSVKAKLKKVAKKYPKLGRSIF